LPKDLPLGTVNQGTELASAVLDPTVFPHQFKVTAWYPNAKKMMTVAMAVPVSIAANFEAKLAYKAGISFLQYSYRSTGKFE
jgi:hypothetical protein